VCDCNGFNSSGITNAISGSGSVVLNSINLEGQGRQPPVVTAQPPIAQPPAASRQLFAVKAASRLHT